MFDSITFNFTIGNFFCNSFSRMWIPVPEYLNSTVIKLESITCPHCGSRMHVYDNASVTLREIPFNSLYYTIFKKVHVHYYRCTKCRASITENIPFKYKDARITDNAAEFVKSLLMHHMSVKDVSLMTGINWNTIASIHKEFMKENLSKEEKLRRSNYKPRYLAVDEFRFTKAILTQHALWIWNSEM